ncbi:hypothetical protein Lfu02_27220 [Longispora fulva]|uniref:Uncharacterized protein n=1 Tax=Longispora fulva TaxID=619741 RepID=A0A8J7KY63_9ACTN|nr:hypothetical protein [Longispora fulva]MBG6138857.1 hypothetical protein [Longispora fulva]GIG58350.1 hypothetical protein Lfu02_27220 [Longispora fulva]
MSVVTRIGTLDTLQEGSLSAILQLRLENDGYHDYWLFDGDTYVLRHDEHQWRVTGGSWFEDGHVYRLTQAGRPVATVPTSDGIGSVLLLRPFEYLFHQGGNGDWLVSQCV